MKIIHQNGYSQEELSQYRLTIYKNLVDCSKALIGAMRQCEIEPQDSGNVENCEFLLEFQVDPDPQTSLDPKVGAAAIQLWQDKCMEALMERQSEFYLMDSAP
jgi:guanine nucleotide-binding protein G(i) subunit alpha